MAKVIVREGETLESALRRFKRQVQEDNIMGELKKREFYMAPSLKRRMKRKVASERKTQA